MPLAILDTDILSELYRAKNEIVVRRAAEYVARHNTLVLSVVSMFEILSGWHRVNRGDKVRAFSAWLNAAEVLHVDTECAALAGEIDGALARAGRPVGVADVLIAATAIRFGRTLVTGNTVHYEHIRSAGFALTLENCRA